MAYHEVSLLHVAAGVAATAVDAARAVARLPGVAAPARALADRGERAISSATVIADGVLRRAIAKIVSAALAEIDLTRLIRDNVDIDAIIEGIDLDRAVARVDLDKAVERVDLDKAVARVDVNAVVARADVDAVVARADVDAVVARADVDAVVNRIDLVTLANFVIDGVDLPSIIRESTGSLSAEAVRGVRSQGMQADDAVAQFVGRLFGRDGGHRDAQ